MIYIAAHGFAPTGSNVTLPGGGAVAQSEKARVQIKAPAGGGNAAVDESLGLDDIRKIVHDRPNLTFKLVVEACFSGRWTLAMAETTCGSRSPINQFGAYNASVNATAEDGATASGNSSVTVTAAQGTCPAP